MAGMCLHQGAVLRLCLLQLALRADRVRDVEHESEPELWGAGLVLDADCLLPDPHLTAVAMDRPILLAERLARRDGPLARFDDPVQVVGMQHVAPTLGCGEPLLAGQPQQVEDPGADVDHRVAVVHAIDVEDGRQPVDDAAVTRFEFAVSAREIREIGRTVHADVRQEPALGGLGVDIRVVVVVIRHGLPASR